MYRDAGAPVKDIIPCDGERRGCTVYPSPLVLRDIDVFSDTHASRTSNQLQRTRTTSSPTWTPRGGRADVGTESGVYNATDGIVEYTRRMQFLALRERKWRGRGGSERLQRRAAPSGSSLPLTELALSTGLTLPVLPPKSKYRKIRQPCGGRVEHGLRGHGAFTRAEVGVREEHLVRRVGNLKAEKGEGAAEGKEENGDCCDAAFVYVHDADGVSCNLTLARLLVFPRPSSRPHPGSVSTNVIDAAVNNLTETMPNVQVYRNNVAINHGLEYDDRHCDFFHNHIHTESVTGLSFLFAAGLKR
ncbi:hypothetical protein B0H19DRAFT_1085134 [Mycena capillaripes]|nr:hypothetical protein B0H19DRAFT_1085134 [Mycena capillaripes]